MSADKWRKVGWRSLRHQGYPRIVVRFGAGGPKPKFLLPDGEVSFNTQEMSQGRVPADSLRLLVQDATAHWEYLKSKEVPK
jgi:hypothetical protein